MIQILAFIPGALFGILASLYGTVARIYDIMLSLTGYYRDGGLPDNYIITTSNVTTTMYTLAGVFMLFRVTISMINMLIEPDKINDRQAGTGKMLVRIVTSLALLIILVPTGWVFSKNPDNPGILMRVEKALLAQDGLIHNLMPEVNGEKSSFDGSNKNNGLLIDNVGAVSADQFFGVDKNVGYDCYYIKVSNSDKRIAQKNDGRPDGPSSKSLTRISGIMHLTLYNNSTGKNKLCKPNIAGGTLLAECNYSYNSDSNDPYESYSKSLAWDRLKNGWPSTHNCPNLIDGSQAKDAGANDWYKKNSSGWYGGWHSLEAMKIAVSARNSNVNVTGNDPKKVSAIRNLLGLTGEWLYGVSEEAVNFAQGALSSFIQCTSSSEECEALKASALTSSDSNTLIANELNNDNPTMTLDFMIGVVAGIGLVVWIGLLCVDVIIRRFKLILLEMMAPIPIIAYSDPKDETFSKWLKMYGATYLDLFIKLIAISFAIALLQQMGAAMQDTGLLKFFYIIAILIFAKLIPDMISNIFGIKMGSGTFGQIKDMYKKAFGIGAGALAGGLVGATSALGGGGSKGLAIRRGLKGIAKGATSGAKGNILGGADSIRKENLDTRRANLNYSTAAGRASTAFMNFLGQSDAYEKAKKDLDIAELNLKPKKEAKSAMDAFIDSKDSWEKAVIQQRNFRNFDGKGIDAVDDFYKAKAENQKLTTDFAGAKNAWKVRNGKKLLKLKAEATAPGASAKAISDYNKFEQYFNNMNNMSDVDFISAHNAEVSHLDYDSQLAVFDYEIEKMNSDPNYHGIPGTEGLFDKVRERADELNTNQLYQSQDAGLDGHQIVLDRYTTDASTGAVGLKSTATKVMETSRDRGAAIGQEERRIESERRELENGGLKADHDAVAKSK